MKCVYATKSDYKLRDHHKIFNLKKRNDSGPCVGLDRGRFSKGAFKKHGIHMPSISYTRLKNSKFIGQKVKIQEIYETVLTPDPKLTIVIGA